MEAEKLIIPCIEDYPNNNLKIVNRHGDTIFNKSGYKNNWSGINSKTGKLIKQGTYFYVLILEDNKKPIHGWIHLHFKNNYFF